MGNNSLFRTLQRCRSMFCVAVFVAASYGQSIGAFSAVRDVKVNGKVGEQVLDLTISLHRTWSEMAGDSSLRASYENVIRYWADGIYEMTNGGHRLGKIRIFTNSRFASSADVRWIAGVYRANASLGGFMSTGGITFGDTLFKYSIPGVDLDWQGAGYTLAHESGHYIYSMFDEYDISAGKGRKYTDDTTLYIPTIMNNQWEAMRGNYEHLNFSTSSLDSVYADTEQWRWHGIDAWTALTSASPNGYQYRRYEALEGRKPDSTTYYVNTNSTSDYYGKTYPMMTVELPSTYARDSLKIIWMTDTIAIDLVLDRSESMTGKPLEDTKIAAKAFIDAINVFGKDFNVVPIVGVTTFSTQVENICSLAVLNDTTTNKIKNVIEAVNADDKTAMFDACIYSANKLLSESSNESTRLCMLFTDGLENKSNEKKVANVLRPFVANNIPIYSFGYGSVFTGIENCKELSVGTNGKFFDKLTNSDTIITSWLEIFDDAADLQYVASAAFSASAGLEFTIDPTVLSSVVEVRYTLHDTGSYCAFTVVDNNGMLVASTISTIPLGSSYPQNEIALISIDSSAVAMASVGTWTCYASSFSGVVTDVKGLVRIKGKSSGTYAVTIDNYQNGFYTWPQPLRLSAATKGKQGFITDLNVTATLTSPTGSIASVVLSDGGVNGDVTAHDGIYSLDYSHYTENGQYTLTVQFDNNTGNAYYAKEGVCYSFPLDSSAIDTIFVEDDFVRTKTAFFHISGVNAQPPTKTGSIMGFESDTLWSIISGAGVLSSSAIRTEGRASLQIVGNGWQQIKSHDVNTEELYSVTNTLALDLFVGNTQTNPHWTGQVQLFVNCPTAHIYNQHIGFVNLTSLPLDVFSTLSFTLPTNIVDILNGSYSDFSFSLSINTNANTGAYYFDNMRFKD